jgi:hypothetical protein
MQISKLLPMVCAAAFFAGLVSVRADDNPAQAAARASLMEKMNESDVSPAPTNTETPPPMVVAPSGAEQQAPPVTTTTPPVETPPVAPAEPQPALTAPATSEATPTPGVTPIQTPEPAATMTPAPNQSNPAAPATTSADNEAQAAARAALLEKMNQDAQTGPEHPILINSSGVVPEQTTQPAPMLSQPPTNSVATPAMASPPGDTEQQARKEREKAEAAARAQAKAQAEQEAKAQKEAAISPPPVDNGGADLGLQPIQAPALPISADQEMRLQALDAKYKADQISPREYFKQREEILGGP